jgi:uncharacterized damage-inducible protein DinB
MKAFFTDIFTYHHHFNQKLIDQLIAHEKRLPDRTIPLFCHTLNAHQIWNARITIKDTLAVHQIHPLEACKSLDQENYQETLKILEERALDEMIVYGNSKGTEFSNSVQEILFHVANHFSHHKGQIISDFRQSGIAPIKTDYILFKR